MKNYVVSFPVSIAGEKEYHRPFDKNVSLTIKARTSKEAVSKLEKLLTTIVEAGK